MPVIYFLYPETANRSLENIDVYYRGKPSLIVTRDPDAISSKRPIKFEEQEADAIAQTKEIGGIDAVENVVSKSG